MFFLNFNTTYAAVRTWTGDASGDWSVDSNWDGPAPVTGDDLVFPNGASNLSNNNDLTPNTIFNSITFTGSGYTLSGNPIILGPGLAGITDSASSGGNAIAFDIRLDTTRDIVVTNSAESLTVSGRITGVGGINKEGLGKVILSGANTFGGILKINVGTVNAQNDRALGTILAGTEVVGGATLELQGGVDISYEALALRGYGVSGGGALRNVSDNNTFRGLITLSSAGGAEISSDSGAVTLAGGITGNFPLVFDGAGDIVFSAKPIAGSGTITKNGAGTVTLNFPNTNTGAWTINQGKILYGIDNALMSNAINITNGTLDIDSYSDMVGTVTLGTLDLANATITGTTGVLSSGTWTVYNGTISAIISGVAGTLTKSTTGTVTLTRDNLYTGATTVSAGTLKIQSNYALGAVDGITTVSAGATLQIDGSGLSIPERITFSGYGMLYTGAIYNTGGDNTLIGLLGTGAATMIKANTSTTLIVDGSGLSAPGHELTIDGEGNITFTSSAPIYGATTASIVKNGTGILTIQSSANFTNPSTINRGEVVLSGNGVIPSSTISINAGGTLTLDNSTTSMLNRISDTAALTMRGGTFNFIGNVSGPSQELVGALTLSEGHNVITVTPGSGGSTTMTFASLARTNGATALFRGTNLGSNPGANISTIMFTSAPAVLGGGGSANSTTISVIKGAFGDNSITGTGTDMVTYNVGNTNGLRLLNGAGFSGEYSSTLTTNTNVKLTANTAASTVSINSLILNGYDITNASATITLSSGSLAGNILMNSANTIAGAGTVIGITTNHLDILATASATISATIGTAVAGSVGINGTGAVTISRASLYTGTTFVNSGTLTYGVNDVISSGGVTIINGTLDIVTFTDTVGAVTLQNGTITGSSGVLTGTSYSFREGTVSAIIAGSGTTTIVATNAPVNTVVLMTGNNTYSGTTAISSGILKLGGSGNGTNTPLGTTGGGTTITSGATLDLNGYTLSTAEAITSLNGTGFGTSAMGALINTNNTAVSYSGAITLGAASRINADFGAMTISSAISGNFALTFGGFSNIEYSGVRSGTSTIVKDGIGVLTLSNGNSSYTGATTISVGTVKIGAVSVGGTNSPLGTTGGATTVALGSRLDLNGFDLGIAEPLTINGVGYGLGDFASGALMNSSGSSVSYTGTVTLGSASTVKADSGNITLSAVSATALGLTIGGVGNGTISGVVALTTGTVSKIGAGTWTLSNAASTYTGATNIYNGTLKLGASGGATNTPLGTTGGATVVYSGAALDIAGYTLGTAEGLTLNGRGIGNGGALLNSGGAATFAGAITQATDSRISSSGSGLTTLSGGVTGAFALYVGGSQNITFSTAALAMSTGTLTKQGSGTVTITFAGTYTGATRIDEGTLAEGVTSSLSSGSVEVKGGTFDMATFSDTVGAVTLVGGSITGTTGVLTATSYTLEGGTVSAILAGAVAVTKNTNNEVVLTNANTVSSTVTINGGTLTMSGSGTAVSVTGVTVNLGGKLVLDNSGTNVASRIGDAVVVTMNGGELAFIGKDSTTVTETIGQLALSSGHNIVTIDPKAGSGGSGTTLTFANNPGLNRTAGATVLFRGTNLGSAPTAGVANLKFTTVPTVTGAGGGSGTTTISVIKGAFGDNSITGTGTDMVTYNVGNTNGLRLLNGAGFSGEYSSTLTTNTNVKLTANTAASTVSINSLILNGFGITNPGSTQTITMGSASLSANILMNSATNIAGANTTIAFSTVELSVLSTSTSTISAILNTASSGPATFSGPGNVTLSAANAYTGTTSINNTTVTYGANNVISSGGVTIVGGTLDLNGNSDTVGALSINAGTIKTASGTLTGNGSFTTIANNNVASRITGNLGLGANATFNVGDGLMDNDAIISAVVSGAFTVTKSTGTGVLLLSGDSTYSGTTTISAGIIRLGANGGATNTPLGTTAGGTTVASGAVLDLNGYSLGTTEALTISGTGISTSGVIINTSSGSATYSGLLTLGAASTITSNYGDINISNGGNITGNTLALTIGGAGNGTLSSNLNTTTGTLTKNGVGTWTISGGASTFTGLTTISAGTLKLGSAGSGSNTPLGTNAGGVTVTSGAIFDLNGYTLATAEPIGSLSGTGIASIGALINSSNNSVTYSGAITLAANSRVANYGNGVMTLSGNISGNFALTTVTVGGITQSSASIWSGTGTLIKEGSGTLILSGQNTMTGAMTVSTGVLQLGASGGATNTPLGTNAGGVTVSLGAVLDLSTYSLGGASTYETLTLNGTGIGNGGALISSASGANNFGAVTVSTSTLIKNSGSGTIDFTGTVTIAASINFGVTGAGPVTVSGVFGASAVAATINKWDSGILVLGSATKPGVTTGLVRVNGGTIKYGVADALSTPAVTINGGTLDLNGFNETNIGAVTLINGSIVNTGGAATLTSTSTYTLENGTVSAVLGSAVAAGIAKNAGGKVILSGNNTFTSTSIAVNAGYLNVQHSNALGASGTALATTVSAGATLELQNNITLPSTKTLTIHGLGMQNNGAIRNISDTNVISATPALGSTNARINSDSGSLTIPALTGNTFNTVFGGAGDITVSGVIGTTSGAVTKDGAGNTTLSGTNTYTGPTTLLEGIVLANTTASIGNGSATNTLVFNGGTLQATGTITSGSSRAVTLGWGGGIIDSNGNSVSIAGTVGSSGGLTKAGAGTLTLSNTTTIGRDLTISAGTFVAPTSLTINGDFINNDTYTHNNGTVTIVPTNETKTSSILGSSNTTFYNLTNTTAGSTLKFKAGNTYTFSNLLTLIGTFAQNILIDSDTSSSRWLMRLTGSSSVDYLQVKNSGCAGGNDISSNPTLSNLGNNGLCWFYVMMYGGSVGSVESSATPNPDQGGGGSGGGSGAEGGGGGGNQGGGGSGGGDELE